MQLRAQHGSNRRCADNLARPKAGDAIMKAINNGIVLIRGGKFGKGILERFEDDLLGEVTVREAHPQAPAGRKPNQPSCPAGGHLTVIQGDKP